MGNIKLLVILALLTIVAGCIGSNSRNTPPPDSQDHQAITGLDPNQFPPFPVDRDASVFYLKTIYGGQFTAKSGNANVNGDYQMELGSNFGNTSWGIWKFYAASDPVSNVSVFLELAFEHTAYIGLADYSRGSWEFLEFNGPFNDYRTVPVDDARHKSPGGFIYVAVVVSGFSESTVDHLRAKKEGKWKISHVDDSSRVNTSTSLMVINGEPVISFYDSLSHNLAYVRAMNMLGTVWGDPVYPHISSNYVGLHPSLAVIDGNPAIAYHLATEELWYVRAIDDVGNEWGDPLRLDVTLGGGSLGKTPSLGVVGGFPAVSYGSDSGLKFCRASDAQGSNWNPPQTLVPSELIYAYTTLVIESGNPIVSYFDANANNGSLKLIASIDATGSSWYPPQYINGSFDILGEYASGAIINNKLCVAYYDATNKDLIYSHWHPVAEEWVRVVVDAEGDVGKYCSLAVIAGKPAISYYDVTNTNLKYVQALDLKGETWDTPMLVDDDGNVGQYSCLAEVDGKPGISYSGNLVGNVKFAIKIEP